ncbi:hypothetical protein [uncultured Phycicoccus sp.]|uniref:hypothetical protein n=1 Tax=uncultured Phycicoccus sp. TaxID=661422 RepID=UPI0026149A55|nr:hypothetical protein [uncultured Phycicoccus sp.]
MRKTLSTAAGLALAATCLAAAPAHADPPAYFDITLQCDGETFAVSVAGNGDWTPAHDLNSPLVGVPIAFGEFTGTFTPTDGEPETFTEPAYAKPNVPRTRNLIVDCTYTVAGEFEDGSFTGYGSVTLMVPRVH